MQELLYKRLANILSIKSLVTLVFTGVFAVLALRLYITPEVFTRLYEIILLCYFGTQVARHVGTTK